MHYALKIMRRAPGAAQLRLGALIASFSIAVAGCATHRSLPNATIAPIFLEAKVVNTFGNSVMSENRQADPTVALGAIPGDIRGDATRTLQFIHMADRPMIAINADALSAKTRSDLSRETDEFLISGLSVEPADTRFARISARLMKKGSPAANMAAGFINADSYDPMMLFYFDRPCRVTGVISGENGGPSLITYDADVKKAGLTWLVAIPQESGGAIMLVANKASSKMFVAAPADNLKDGRFQLK